MIDFLYQLPFPHIIAGDFNTEPESVEIQHLLGNRALGKYF
jgi:endonuclease/exonuclease/phosphatase family metal-dependent hydrolase